MDEDSVELTVDAADKKKAQPRKPPEVIIYSTSVCPYCTKAKNFLDARGVKYQEFDVSKDEEKAREMYNRTRQGAVPVLDINGRIVIGYDPQLIEDALGRERPPKRETFLQNLFFDPFNP